MFWFVIVVAFVFWMIYDSIQSRKQIKALKEYLDLSNKIFEEYLEAQKEYREKAEREVLQAEKYIEELEDEVDSLTDEAASEEKTI